MCDTHYKPKHVGLTTEASTNVKVKCLSTVYCPSCEPTDYAHMCARHRKTAEVLRAEAIAKFDEEMWP